ncbi:uncharacterized protein Ir62a [Drosophila montana]|uniref:uncharacterized protein Ir62a n=1 Tax=Drosophila montana TaxID=40370 RepID=UPI00313EA1F0
MAFSGSMLPLLLLLQLQLQLVGNATNMAQFLERIGRVHQLQAISIVHSADATGAGFQDALHLAMHQEHNYFRLLPKLISTENSAGLFSSLTHEQTLFVIFARDSRDAVIELQAERARGRRYCKTFFLLRRDETRANLRSFFEYLWQQGFRSALVMVAQRRLYHMDPYPTLRVLELSATQDAGSLFPPPNRRDFMGYKLRVPVQLDVPATFWYPTAPHQLQLDGAGGTLLRELMRHLNVCLELYPLYINGSNNINMQALVQLVAEQRAELSPHQFTTLQPTNSVDYSYPYAVVPRCFMLPIAAPFPRSLYVILPLQPTVWLGLLIMLLLVLLMRYLKRRLMPQLPSLHLWSLLGVPGSQGGHYAAVYTNMCWSRFARCLLLFGVFVFAAFIIVQLYATKLTSLLTVSLSPKPSVTLLELLRLPYPILVLPGDVNTIVSVFGHEEQFRRQFYFTNDNDFYAQRVEMSAGYIYPISTLRWRFLSLQQRYLKHKRFWLSSLCYGTFPAQFQLRIGSHFLEPLHQFELHVHEAGLPEKWRRVYYHRAKQLGYVRDFASVEHFEQMHEVRPLALNLLSSVVYLYLIGLLVGLGAFLLEFVL